MTKEQIKMFQEFLEKEGESIHGFVLATLNKNGMTQVNFSCTSIEMSFLIKAADCALSELMSQSTPQNTKGPELVKN